MKKMMVLLSALVVSQSAFAVPSFFPGAIRLHTMECTSEGKLLGSTLSLEFQTQALQPEHTIRSCTVYRKPVVPDAEWTPTELVESSQTALDGVFTQDNLVVTLVKGKPYIAVVSIDHKPAYTCREVEGT